MSDLAAAQALLERSLGRRLRTDYPLAPLTTFRIGGRAALFVEPQDQADLLAVHRAVAETDLPVAILGRGRTSSCRTTGSPASSCASGGGTGGRRATVTS